jgi:hypothetical protein
MEPLAVGQHRAQFHSLEQKAVLTEIQNRLAPTLTLPQNNWGREFKSQDHRRRGRTSSPNSWMHCIVSARRGPSGTRLRMIR